MPIIDIVRMMALGQLIQHPGWVLLISVKRLVKKWVIT